MADFLGKSQVQVGGIEPQRVANLSEGLAGLLGATAKGVEAYNTIGETAAKLDFRDISHNTATAMTGVERRMSELAPDDVEGYETLMGEVESLKSNYTTNLSKYSGHKAAFDVFSDSASTAILQLDSKANIINGHRHKAAGLQNLTAVAKDGDLGLLANQTSFDTSITSLRPFYGEKAVAATQTAYFEPLYAQAVQNKNSKNIEEERSVIDPKLGYATVDTVSAFMNKEILKDSEMASIGIVTDVDGKQTFKVNSKFTEEQNSRLVALANFYMGQHVPAPSGERQYPFLNALADTVSKTETTIQNTDSVPELQRTMLEIKNQFDAYMTNPEKESITKDSPQHQKLYSTYASAVTAVNKRTAVLNAVASGHTVAENTAAPVEYRIQNFAKLMYPEDTTTKDSVGTVSNDEIKAAYKHLDNQALAAFQANNPALAQALSEQYTRMTGEDSQLNKMIGVVTKTGISTATTVQEVSAQRKLVEEKFARGEMSETDYFAVMRGFDAQITHADKNGKLTAAGGTGMRTALSGKATEKWSANPNNQKKLEAAKTTPWLSDARISAETFQSTEKVLIKRGLMKPWDDPSAIGALVANNLVYGMNKTLLPKLDPSLGENQMISGMSQFIKTYAKQKKININTDPDNISISVDPSSTAYLVKYKLSSGVWSTDNVLITPKQIAIHANYRARNPIRKSAETERMKTTYSIGE